MKCPHCGKDIRPADKQDEPCVIFLLTNTGEEFGITEYAYHEFTEIYPNVDVMAALRSIKGWLISNPTRRKTRRGMMRFVNAWLAKEQDRGRPMYGNNNAPQRLTKLQRAAKAMEDAFGGQAGSSSAERVVENAGQGGGLLARSGRPAVRDQGDD